jgi:uncharacterized hydantoinase/oxoprolinase family protein
MDTVITIPAGHSFATWKHDDELAEKIRDLIAAAHQARVGMIMARESELGAFDLEAVRQLGRYVI